MYVWEMNLINTSISLEQWRHNMHPTDPERLVLHCTEPKHKQPVANCLYNIMTPCLTSRTLKSQLTSAQCGESNNKSNHPVTSLRQTVRAAGSNDMEPSYFCAVLFAVLPHFYTKNFYCLLVIITTTDVHILWSPFWAIHDCLTSTGKELIFLCQHFKGGSSSEKVLDKYLGTVPRRLTPKISWLWSAELETSVWLFLLLLLRGLTERRSVKGRKKGWKKQYEESEVLFGWFSLFCVQTETFRNNEENTHVAC